MTHPLAPLAAYRQFLPVRIVPLANGKSDKLPLTPTGELTPKDQGGAHNPAYWMTWAEAHARAVAWGPNHGVGFVLTAADPFWCLDIDGALTPTGWSQLAQDLMAQLPGTAVEVSSSGTGLHIWGQGPVPEHRCKNTQLHIELYHADRFILLGSNPVGSMEQACPHIAAVAARYFPPRLELDQGLAEGPISTWRGPTDDEELLRRMLNSKGSIKAAFGATATFADLWEGNATTLERVFPKPEGGYDGSSVDAALANHLAFWTGCDKARMERLMRRSALVRDKWDREDYMLATIGLACQRDPSQVLQDPAPKVGAMTTLALPEDGGLLTGQVTANLDPFVPAEKQVEMFAGCVYVEDEHKILMPDGSMRRREQFRAKFGGVKFLLGIDNKKTTACAFEAFTENTATSMPKVSGTCYKPQLPYQALLKDSAGRVLVNTYRKPVVDLTPGNIDRFHRHMTLMMPDERDRLIVYSFMAAVLQYPGIKFGWALLVQGCEGGGKTFLNEVLKHGVGIQHYHMVGAKHLDSQFNGWMASKVLYIIEDLFAGDRADVMEVMKPWITNTHVEVESKGVEKRTVEVCGNFLAGSNHKNAVIKRRGDRRWCVIFTAQQDRDRMAAEQGMDARYFKELYDWGRDGGGYGAVCEWLLRWQIPEEFDPSKHAKVAPKTSSTDEAIAASRSPLAQSIVEAIEAEVIGFRGGWIGAEELEQLLERSRAKVAHQKRTEILGELDYMPHPGLPEGRSCQAVLPYGKRVRIFVKRGSPASMMQGPAAIVQAYLAAQGLGSAAS